ncbi:MAG: protease modulator HflK, partial [Gammaproteobacteria bacterium]|nr:protease modulator HflK [Gammaproteobacteria bacterium]
NTSKVLVDVKGGGNLLYLPLDKMMSGGTGDTSSARRLVEGDSSSQSQIDQRLRDSIRGRGER